MNFYPYDSNVIITDAIYTAYGGDITIASQAQRNAAYWMAEEKASEDLETFLLPTIVTGTFLYRPGLIILDHSHVNYVSMVRFLDFEGDVYFTATGTTNVYFNLYNDERGLLDVAQLVATCNCNTSLRPSPYKLQVVYQAGLPSGTSFRPDILLALTTYSTIILNEIIGYGNESVGDIGVAEYRNQEYSERRKGMINTTFGSSAKANFAYRMLTRLRKRRHVSL